MNANNPNLIRLELETLDSVTRRLETGGSWHNIVIQNVDLTSLDDDFSGVRIAGCHFVGCNIGPNLAAAIATAEIEAGVATTEQEKKDHPHCLVFPPLPGLPFNPYRSSLYSAEELVGRFTTEHLATEKPVYEASVDWKSYLTFADPTDTKAFTNDSLDTVLARRLHDTSISDALDELLAAARDRQLAAKKGGIVAIMGGHDMLRLEKLKSAPAGSALGEEEWEGMSDDSVFTRVAFLAWRLTNLGYLLVSGGGPGAMEACNLGAYFATRTLGDLRAAIRKLEDFKEFKSGKSTEWLIPAMKVRRDFPLTLADALKCQSLGIPTWLYGHEPPNPFATHIAKYFENSVREEGLLAIASHGVIFAEGNAGTVQEIFQDACQNYYSSYGTAAPMILFGQEYWDPAAMPVYVNDKRKKAFPLIRKLAEEKGFTHRLIVTDSLREIVKTITSFKP
jgi:predicted Rossmann-fold nucleotide-binding protein